MTTDFLNFVAPNLALKFTEISNSDMLQYSGFCLGIAILIGMTWIFIREIREESGKVNVRNIFGTIIFASFAGIAILGYTLHFAINLYPKIPAVVGGGQPIETQFMLTHDDNYEYLKDVFNFDDNQELSPRVKLLTTTDEDYVFIHPINIQRVILLPKDSVSLFIFDLKY